MDITLHVLIASLFFAPCWAFFDKVVLGVATRFVDAGADGGEAPKKMASAATTASSHLVQFLMWWAVVFSAGLTPWVFDTSGWTESMLPRPQDVAERDMLAPFYVICLGFTWHSLVKDIRRSWGNLKSLDQISFLLPHVAAVLLVAGAFKVGCWRAGVLTRLIHDPADIFLYGSKFYQGYCDQPGRGNRGFLAFLYLLTCVVWALTRVILYGYFVLCINGVLLCVWDGNYGAFTTCTCVAFWLGSCIMWLLQITWPGAILAATRKFLRSKGQDTVDHLDHGQPEEKTAPLLAKDTLETGLLPDAKAAPQPAQK